jgi:peptide/nickel transport system substrate-binding protein
VPRAGAWGLAVLAISLILGACGPRSETPTRPSDRAAAPKRVVVAVMGDPPTLYNKLNQNNSVPGVDAIEELVHVGLTHADRFGVRGARLAREVPSVENGLWRVFPDGSMELTWHIRPDAQWHDGVPVTSADLVFTSQLERDPDLAVLNNRLYDAIASVEAPDPQTIAVRWTRPYINADEMFSYRFASPLPRHILEAPYLDRKAALLDEPYWTAQYVGAGPYRLREFTGGSHLLLEANDRYVLGRPRIDTLEVRFILDSNAMLANILAGAIDVTLGRTVSLDQAVQIKDAWRDGAIEVGYKSWLVLYPQFLDPTPAVVGDVRFRRALLHAIDRQQLADSLMAGLSTVAHNYLNPQEPEYQETLPLVTRYEHDPRRAISLIEELGYSRGVDGAFRDRAGERLGVNIQTTAQLDIHSKTMYPVADSWQRVGVEVETFLTPAALVSDRAHRATFPSFSLAQNPDDRDSLGNLHSSGIPVQATRYVGINKPRYGNSTLDALLDQYLVTIPRQSRVQVLGQIVGHVSEQLVVMGLFYGVEPTLVANRVLHVAPRIQDSTQARNAHEWELRQVAS